MTPAGIERPEICSPSESDIRDLLALEHACFDSPYYHPIGSPNQFQSYLRNQDAVFMTAMQQHLLAGYRGVVRGTDRRASRVSPWCRPREGEGSEGSCCGDFQRGEAKRRGSSRVTLEVVEANERAIRFFATRVFKPVRRLAAYYGGRFDGLRLGRAL